jgi:hypothetical protein
MATEYERDEVADRDRTRRIAQSAVDTFLNAILYTGGRQTVDAARLWEEAGGMAIPAAREFRVRQRRRAVERLVALDSDDDPADLSCEVR